MPAPIVMVMRPPQQAASLCQALQSAGALAIPLPVIDIEAIQISQPRDPQHYDWLLFTSPNAVVHGLPSLLQPPAMLAGPCRVAAVGAATARALSQAGVRDVLLPGDDYSSEGLLGLSALQDIQGQRVLLVKGEGGRALLASALRERGAQLDELVVYRRRLLSPPTATLTSAIHQASHAIVTSGEILQRLFELTPMGARDPLLALQLVVPSARVVQMAQSMGFQKVCPVPSPLTEQALVRAVLDSHPQATVPG